MQTAMDCVKRERSKEKAGTKRRSRLTHEGHHRETTTCMQTE